MIYGDYKTVMICSECLSSPTPFFLFFIFLLFHAEFRVEWCDGLKISRLYTIGCKVLAEKGIKIDPFFYVNFGFLQ